MRYDIFKIVSRVILLNHIHSYIKSRCMSLDFVTMTIKKMKMITFKPDLSVLSRPPVLTPTTHDKILIEH